MASTPVLSSTVTTGMGGTNPHSDHRQLASFHLIAVVPHIAQVILYKYATPNEYDNYLWAYMKALLKKLDMIIDLLLKDREERQKDQEALAGEKKEKERAEAERLLVEYAQKHGKRLPTGGVWSSREAQDKPINSGGELIPMNISSTEKQILRDFYESYNLYQYFLWIPSKCPSHHQHNQEQLHDTSFRFL